MQRPSGWLASGFTFRRTADWEIDREARNSQSFVRFDQHFSGCYQFVIFKELYATEM